MYRRPGPIARPTESPFNVPTSMPFAGLQTALNRMFDDTLRGFAVPATGAGTDLAIPDIDVSEDDANVVVTAELPGLGPDEVEVEYADGVLRIAGEKTAEREGGPSTRRHVSERYYGRVERRIPIDRAVDRDAIDASFRDGVLTVTLPKSGEGDGSRKIAVKRAG